jgi:hypothetical protein
MCFVSRFRNALKWNSALDFVAQSDFEQALIALHKIDSSKPGYPRIDFFLLEAYLKSKKGRMEEAKLSIAAALQLLDKIQGSQSASAMYKRKYAECIVARMHGLDTSTSIDYSEVHLESVDSRTKNLFPLRGHPNWSTK